MSDTAQTTSSESSLRVFALLGYGLLLLACSNGITGIVGVVIAYIKRDEARGTVYESHFANMIVTFWAAIVFIVLALAAASVGVLSVIGAEDRHQFFPAMGIGILLYGSCVVFAVWYLYRIIRGFVRALDARAY